MNGIRHAPSAPKTEAPRLISGAADKNANVIPIDSPVMTMPIPKLRFSKGDWYVITVRSLE